MTTPTTGAAVPAASALLPAETSGVVGKRIGEFVDLALEGQPTALTRNNRRPAVLVAASWFDRQPGAHANTMGIRTPDDHPIPRDSYAQHLDMKLDPVDHDRPVALTQAEAEVVSDLLDELAAVYSGEELGMIARRLSSRIYDRMGEVRRG